MKKVHYFQHVDFETLGCIDTWLKKKGYSLTSSKFYTEYEIPDVADIDWLIVMGGPMGIYDDTDYEYLIKERQFIAEAIKKGKTVLGICLGSQFIADALGSKVFANQHKEIGWFPIHKTAECAEISAFDGFKESQIVFHWHGDTFETPDNAQLAFSSDATKNQAFIYNENVIGLQFHLEVTPVTLKAMVENGKQKLKPANFIQSEHVILDKSIDFKNLNELMFGILDYLDQV